jgi:hypothetical protein
MDLGLLAEPPPPPRDSYHVVYNAKLLIVKVCGTKSYHSSLKCQSTNSSFVYVMLI